jgi:hypothetical protein
LRELERLSNVLVEDPPKLRGLLMFLGALGQAHDGVQDAGTFSRPNQFQQREAMAVSTAHSTNCQSTRKESYAGAEF